MNVRSKLTIGIAALLLAIAAGTAAYAMNDGGSSPARESSASTDTSERGDAISCAPEAAAFCDAAGVSGKNAEINCEAQTCSATDLPACAPDASSCAANGCTPA